MHPASFSFANQENPNAQSRFGSLGTNNIFGGQQQVPNTNAYAMSGFNINPQNPFAQNTNNTAFGFVRHQDKDNSFNPNNNPNNNNSGNNNFM